MRADADGSTGHFEFPIKNDDGDDIVAGHR